MCSLGIDRIPLDSQINSCKIENGENEVSYFYPSFEKWKIFEDKLEEKRKEKSKKNLTVKVVDCTWNKISQIQKKIYNNPSTCMETESGGKWSF